MKKKIAILTTLSDLNPSYSLVTVILQQLKILEKFGYQPVLYTLTNFKDTVPEYVELRNVIPQFVLEPYATTGAILPANFDEDVDKAAEVFLNEMKDIDCVIAHDIFFINSYLIYNVAYKKAQMKLPLLSQMHSAPSVSIEHPFPWNELWKVPEGAKIIYMNHSEQVAAAEMYGLWAKDVKVVYNPMDLRLVYKLSDFTSSLIDEYNLFDADIICVYPVSSTRMGDDGKAVRKVISVMGHLKALGQNVRLIIPNAHANADNEKNIINEYLRKAAEANLDRNEVIFTSFHDVPKWEQGIPHEYVIELFQIANLFIFPSFSENAPLILLEAAATKNLLVLNEDFNPMLDFLGPEASFNFRFKSRLIQGTEYRSGEENYYSDIAKIVLSDLNDSKINKAFTTVRKKFNLDSIGRNMLIPAIEEAIYERLPRKSV